MTGYSILEHVHPSDDQREAVTQRGRDTVVVAGAGAGKTRALVARYLRLVEEGLPLRSVVAITFTIKAAREMRNRIRDEITRFAAREDLPPDVVVTWQAHAGALDAARISTIHSLCGDILRSHPAEAGLDPRFTVITPADGARHREAALDEVMSWAADDAGSLPLFTLLGVAGLRGALRTLLDRRLDARAAVEPLRSGALAHWCGFLARQQQAALDSLFADPEWREAAATVCAASGARADDLIEMQRRAAASALSAASSTAGTNEKIRCLRGLAGIDLKGGRIAAWPDAQALAEVKAALAALRQHWLERKVLALELNELDEALAGAMPALIALFERAEAVYTSLKARLQGLDFDDLESRALALLECNPAVRERWQQEVAALLVDEYQDTNGRQNRLVRLLAPPGEGKLFIVGDAKQSIYGFRGADVTVFQGEQDALRSLGQAPVHFDESYRAHPGLLDLLNALMRPILGEGDPGKWRVPFRALKPHRDAACPGFVEPHVEVLLSAGKRGDGAPAVATRLLAARLVEIVDGGTCAVVEDGVPRPLRWDDIAILCRASGSFAVYEAAFEEAGIPFLTVAGGGFYNRPEIRDLLNALDAIADPTDDLALAGLLRSPAFGVSDPGLFRLAQAHRASDNADLWQTLRSAGPTLPGEDGPAAARAVAQIDTLHAQAGRLTVAAVLKNFVDAAGYQAALVAAGQSRATRNVEKLLADATTSGLVSVGDFVEYIRGVRETGVREGEARAADERAVQIMSVHAAKGLEFPIVVIGDAGRTPGNRKPQVIIDPDMGPVLAIKDDAKTVCAVHKLADMRRAEREAAESDRLLYVAATRAREKLIVNGCVTVNDSGAISAAAWLKQLLSDSCLGITALAPGSDLDAGAPIHRALDGHPVLCRVVERHAGPAPRTAPVPAAVRACPLPPPLLAPVRQAAARQPEEDREREIGRREWRIVPASSSAPPPPWVVGILVHEALAAWRFSGPDFEGWLTARGRECGLADAAQLERAVRRATRLLARFAGSALYREMDGARQRFHETPYQAQVDGRLENGSIDALYLPQHGEPWVIVEFKTDYIAAESDAYEWLEGRGYLDQARRYVRAVEQLLARRPRCLFCLLNHAKGVRLVELPAG